VRPPLDEQLPPDLAERSTEVGIYLHAWVQGSVREQVNVFAIDPETFVRASYWDDSFADESLDELVDRLAAAPEGGRVPVVIVGVGVPRVADAGIEVQGTTRFEVEQV